MSYISFNLQKDFLNIKGDIQYNKNGNSFRDIILNYADSNHDGTISSLEDGLNASEKDEAYAKLITLLPSYTNEKNILDTLNMLNKQNNANFNNDCPVKSSDDIIAAKKALEDIRKQQDYTITAKSALQYLNTLQLKSLESIEKIIIKTKKDLSEDDNSVLANWNVLKETYENILTKFVRQDFK